MPEVTKPKVEEAHLCVIPEDIDQSKFTAYYFRNEGIETAKREGWVEYYQRTQVPMNEHEKEGYR